MEKKYALIVVDMINDFVYGKLKCDNAQKIIKPVNDLIEFAHKNNIPVIYTNDSHIKGRDYELNLWGEHAMKNSIGAKLIDDIKLLKNDIVVLKSTYSGFFKTKLDKILKKNKIDTLIICGLNTHICVRHTIADAFYRGYETLIVKDTTTSFTDSDYLDGIKYIESIYKTKLISLDDIK